MAQHTAAIRERNYNAERKVAESLLQRYLRAKDLLTAVEPELRAQVRILEEVRTRYVKDAEGPHVDPQPLDFSVLDADTAREPEPEQEPEPVIDFHDQHFGNTEDRYEPAFT